MITSDCALFMTFTIIMFFGFAVSIAAKSSYSNRILSLILPFCFSIFAAIGIIMSIKTYREEGTLEKQYEIKVKAVKNAEKELKKFLIDYPEFEK